MDNCVKIYFYVLFSNTRTCTHGQTRAHAHTHTQTRTHTHTNIKLNHICNLKYPNHYIHKGEIYQNTSIQYFAFSY